MNTFQRIPTPKLYLFLLTLRSKGQSGNVYSLGENVHDAFDRYMQGMVSRKENSNDIEFLAGEFANPHMNVSL